MSSNCAELSLESEYHYDRLEPEKLKLAYRILFPSPHSLLTTTNGDNYEKSVGNLRSGLLRASEG
jgi:hypothetical protein